MSCIVLVPFLNLIILAATLAVLIFYARDTNRIANQTQEANLRPVILRAGYIPDWDSLKLFDQNQLEQPTIIVFHNLKNIAADTTGYVVINKNKYQLLFGNEITMRKISVIASPKANIPQERELAFLPKWGWIQAEGLIYGIISAESREPAEKENQIYISYKDIEGNGYCTIEDSNYSQMCYKGLKFKNTA